MIALLILFAALQIADIVTTIRALKQPGRKEGNPVARWLIARLGYAGLVVLKIPLMAVAIAAVVMGLSPIVLALPCAVYAVIVFNNATGRLW